MADLVWWEVETPEPERFQRFHGALWQWEFRPEFAGSELGHDYWVILDGGRGIGGLQRSRTGAPPEAGVRLYWQVEDLEERLRQVEALGGRVERPRTFLGGADHWFALAADPTGVSFGLWTEQPPTQRP